MQSLKSLHIQIILNSVNRQSNSLSRIPRFPAYGSYLRSPSLVTKVSRLMLAFSVAWKFEDNPQPFLNDWCL